MHINLKRLLLIAIMLVMPIQSFASVAMIDQAAEVPANKALNPVHQAENGMAGCHEGLADQASEPLFALDAQCKHCSACYVTSAFPIPNAIRLETEPPASVPPHFHPKPFIGFIPDGPERPPRTSIV